jgi:small conductance mechanosensitive channel
MRSELSSMPKNLLSKLVEKLYGWAEGFVVMLPNLLLSLCILAAGVVVARHAERLIRQVLLRITRNEPVSRLAGSLAHLGLLATTALWALSLLHLDKTVTSVLAGVGVVGLAVGFAFQDIAANFTSGVIMALNRPFDTGDLVEVAGRQCKVVHMSLRATEVRTLDGLTIIIPNKDVLQSPIVSYTRTNKRRMELNVSTAYSDDMEHVRRVVIEAVQACPGRDLQREVELFFTEFADNGIVFQLRIWLDDASQNSFLLARSEAMIAIKRAFDRERLTIPFPIRTLTFSTDAVGGKPAEHMLRAAEAKQREKIPA